MSRIRILSGVAPYDDPWHPFPQTSAAAADVLRAAGHAVEVMDSTPEALATLDAVDLLVVNTGRGIEDGPGPDRDAWLHAFDHVTAWHDAGGVVLGLHTAANTFHDWPQWPAILGGRWVAGTSFHPPLDEARFTVVAGAEGHPALAGLEQVTAEDERYSALVVNPDSTPLLHHHHEGVEEVMGWAAERAVYDGLGHDARSYQSASRRQLLVNEAAWLLSLRG